MAIPIAIRGSFGLSVNWGPPKFDQHEGFVPVTGKGCRIMTFSPDGLYFAYVNGQNLHLLKTVTWEGVKVIEGTKAYHLAFSPKSTYLCTWEPFVVSNANPQGVPNLKVYKTESGELVATYVHKKQSNWEPQWSCDELIFSRHVNTDVLFYETSDFEKVVHRFKAFKVASYSLSPTVGSYFIVCHTEGGKGQPSQGRLFKYPNFEVQQSLASKSFFQADRVDYFWNSKGTHVLLMTTMEVDKTGASYYGKQGLHFIGTNGQTAMVTLSKEGPIHAISWSPKSQEFCVIYGFMPARATMFNLKCDSVFELGGGPKNSIYYNPQGNILLLGGFGNLRGQIEVWDTSSRKIIGTCEAPDSTMLHWAPDGINFLTATTAPRLRTDNGYKIWHFSGALLFEKMCQGEELYDACWQNYPKGVFKEPSLTVEKVKGIVSSTHAQASQQVYRPPSARNKPLVQFKLHDDDDLPHRPGGDSAPSKGSQKQKKKRESRKARKQEESENGTTNNSTVVSDIQVVLTGDPEKDKKIKNIKRKLDAIAKLKEQQAQGKTLEVNQLAKVKGEDDLINELEELQL